MSLDLVKADLHTRCDAVSCEAEHLQSESKLTNPKAVASADSQSQPTWQMQGRTLAQVAWACSRASSSPSYAEGAWEQALPVGTIRHTPEMYPTRRILSLLERKRKHSPRGMWLPREKGAISKEEKGPTPLHQCCRVRALPICGHEPC